MFKNNAAFFFFHAEDFFSCINKKMRHHEFLFNKINYSIEFYVFQYSLSLLNLYKFNVKFISIMF